MITLKRIEEIQAYQVELALKEKSKQSPFIAILMLAKEQDGITPESLQNFLLKTLPKRACENLLKRLEQQGYLEKTQDYFSFKPVYILTKVGLESAADKSFWIGEKGVFNVYVWYTDIIGHKIINIEQVKSAANDTNSQHIDTPDEIKDNRGAILSINKKDVLIEDIENNCFHLKPSISDLIIQIKDNDAIIKIVHNKKEIYCTKVNWDEASLREVLLIQCKDFHYDKNNKVALTPFDSDNLSFIRNVNIPNPIIYGNQFNSVELENVEFQPLDDQNAQKWLDELLFKNINCYFMDEISFEKYSLEQRIHFHSDYNLILPSRKQFADQLKSCKDAFYHIAKLETIDYLSY